ncbi:Presenilin [Handroanthus impetiginosus]|uniref:Presenilin n=1 Tax=Handroanthus impetiginosus TaxID=429701 RepID=A0A2G9HTQ7_9LAMI|nr:Presenilin [Handroanthus impetiginosus]
MIFSAMGSSILISIIQRFNIPVDAVTFYVLLFNFTILGTISVFSNGIPIIVKQSTMVVLGIIVAAWFSRLPEWTTWVVLVALALYDLAAVLAPGGPLKLLVELASSRDDELPALVYESRPNVGRNSGARNSSLGLLVAAGIGMSGDNNSGAVELQEFLRNGDGSNEIEVREREHLVLTVGENERSSAGEIEEVRDDVGETSPLMERRLISNDSSSYNNIGDSSRVYNSSDGTRLSRGNEREGVEMEENARGIKLGMGDFIFYSVLVGRAAMYDLMTVYACYLAIISGLGCTLILLAVCRHALPALPISITLGVVFYFLTRLLMEPFVVGASTNLMMF